MGNSSAAIAEIAPRDRYESNTHNPFDAAGFQFSVDRRGNSVFHKETRLSRDGKSRTEFEAEVKYVIGSGTRGRSYAIDRDGYLFQSAIGWYNRQQVWDLSPGFAANPHSDRMIAAECLFCHCNRVEPVEDTSNHYQSPIFRGYTIGCERCHGPGDLHVRRRSEGSGSDDFDETIVNPRRLDWPLREAVCQQCHLQGQKRVLKRGRRPFDFRPGLPLELFWSVFVRPSGSPDELRAVGQVEQMYSSRCFRASDGKMGCTSCHDAHEKPLAGEEAAYYRGRCLQCHKETSCGLSLSVRQEQSKADSCIACHMPRFQSSDVSHAAVTDHRIRRKAMPSDTARVPDRTASRPELSDNPLALFTYEPGRQLDQETSRDWGVALTRLPESYQADRQTRRQLGSLALPVLDRAVHARPGDLPAGVAKGTAFWLLDRPAEALTAFEAVLAIAPAREDALVSAAALAGQQGRYEQAIDFWRRGLAVNPWVARYHYELGKLLIIRREWPEAVKECQSAIRLNPFHVDAKQTLVFAYLQLGRKAQAREEFASMMALDPPNAEALRRQFEAPLR
jgi:tetratricopeptide (TPR) repeat protein